MTPAVSVLLPVYNGSRYLREAVAGVLGQSGVEFELIACDDGSPDDSLAVLADLTHPRLRILKNDRNRGLFPTLNRLAGEARGGMLRLWSQDDRMLPGCLAVEADFWSAHSGLGLCYSAYHRIDDAGRVTAPAPPDPTPAVLPPWLATQIMFYHGCLCGNIATMSFPREVWQTVGGFREDMKVSGDFEFLARVAGRYSIGRQPLPLVEVRGHAAQFSQWAGSAVPFMRENDAIFDTLLSRLPPPLRGQAGRYLRGRHHALHVHHAARSALAGRWQVAWQMVRHLTTAGTLPEALAAWLLTVNNKLARPTTIYRSPAGGRFTTIRSDMAAESPTPPSLLT